jgi:predicted nucleic acid-binding Zn ribbon protein
MGAKYISDLIRKLMPTYTFRNKETGEQFEQFMKISERDEYLTKNPQLETLITGAPMMMDPMRAGVRKIDNGFKDVLQQIHSRTPGSKLDL